MTVERPHSQHPEHEHVAGQHDQQARGDRPLTQPGRLVLQVVQATSVVDEPIDQPRSQPEQAHLLGGHRLDGKLIGVVGVAAGSLDLVAVAVAPHPALAQQPVRRPPGQQQHDRRPPRERHQHERRGDASEQGDKATGDEVHVHIHRRAGHPDVEVTSGREIVGEVAPFEVTDPVGAERGGHQPFVEDVGEPGAQVGPHRLVERREHLGADERESEQREGRADRSPIAYRADEPPGGNRQQRWQQRPNDEHEPPDRRRTRNGAGHRREEAPLLTVAKSPSHVANHCTPSSSIGRPLVRRCRRSVGCRACPKRWNTAGWARPV